MQRAVEAPVLGQVAGRREQHGRVPVVAAGVHHPGRGAGPLGAGGLLDRQGVHVGPQPEAARPVAAHQAPDDPGAADAPLDFIAPALELVGHQGGGAVLLERELGMAVDVATQADELARTLGEGMQEVGHADVTAVPA